MEFMFHNWSVMLELVLNIKSLSTEWNYWPPDCWGRVIVNPNEPPHVKTNKMSVCSAKTQISLDIRPVWSESSLCAQWVAKGPRFLHADSEDYDQTGRDAQADLSLRWAHTHFVGFVMSRLKLVSTLRSTMGDIMILSNPVKWRCQDWFATYCPYKVVASFCLRTGQYSKLTFNASLIWWTYMSGGVCSAGVAYIPWTPDLTSGSVVHICRLNQLTGAF